MSNQEGRGSAGESLAVVVGVVREGAPESPESPVERAFQKTTRCLTVLLVSILLSSALLVGLLLFHHRRLMGDKLHQAKKLLERLAVQSPSLVYGLAVVITVLTVVLNLGFHTTLSVLFCLVIKGYWAAVSTLFAGFFLADLVMYFAAEELLCNCLIRRVRASRVFRLLAARFQTAPFRAAFLTRFMMLSPAIKNFALVLVGSGPGPYFASSVVYCATFVNFVYLVASDITEIRDLHQRNVSWSQMSAAQRLVLGATAAVIGLTLGLMLYLFLWVRAELKKEAKRPQEPRFYESKETMTIS